MSTATTTKVAAKQAAKSRRKKARTIPNAITLAIGSALRDQREKLELTQLSVAFSAEVERTRIGKLEAGLVNPSVLSLASICHVLGITLADLFANIRLSHPPTTEGGELRRANQAVLDKPQTKAKPKVVAKTKPKTAPAGKRPRTAKR
ncbi:MAG: helix-turn-helix domain-containing protein [Burkholderiales bacterium]